MTERLLDKWAKKRTGSGNFDILRKRLTRSTDFSSKLTIELLESFELFVKQLQEKK